MRTCATRSGRSSVSLLYHLIRQTDWQAALAAGTYRPESLEREGFIHLSLEHQWPRTRERYYAGVSDLMLLEIDPARITAPVQHEEGEPGELFPHLYGELNLDAVIKTQCFLP